MRVSITLKKMFVLFVLVWFSVATPLTAGVQAAVDATGNQTGAPEETGAPTCTGAGCGQGEGQGAGQGEGQGGPTLEDLGATTTEDGETVLPEGTQDTRQGASQGTAQGTSNGVEATNSETGAGSTNQNDVTTNASDTTSATNTANDTTNSTLTGTTGGNASNKNSGNANVKTGGAGVGVTQVKSDNTTTVNGSAGLQTSAHGGTHNGDYAVGFGAGTASLSGANGSTGSVKATNTKTGADSTNEATIETTTEEVTEVQNDGRIDNLLDLVAVTGQNQANQNTGDATVTTGDADVAATLVNLLNTTVINGDIWVSVADIFGDLNGNILIPELAAFLSSAGAAEGVHVNATNEETGDDSSNHIDVDVTDTETTEVTNRAQVDTTVTAEAITGQNETNENTGGASVATGNGHVSASNVTVANTTVEGGNWGLFVVNALNKWLGFMVSDSGQVQALSQEETIDAINSQTGSGSTNEVDVDHTDTRTTSVDNDARITNDIHAAAITGQNEVSENTGAAHVATGDASVQTTTVNIANTTVKDGSLFVAVVNVFGDWFGDLLYGGNSLAAAAGAGETVAVTATNGTTGAGSENTIDVTVDSHQETIVDNDAEVTNTLNATIDTGNNQANRNTGGVVVETGDGLLALHARSLANLTGIAGDGGLSVEVAELNDTTGFDSENRIRANVNDTRVVDVTNTANVSTVIGSANNPAVVNTGNNTANQNTLGALISTGDAAAEIGIANLVNKVILALAGEGVTVDADLANQLTGALSENSNDITATYDLLVSVFNRGIVDNIMNLLLNTGGNVANENTGGGLVSTGAAIETGDVCAEIARHNEVNQVDGSGGLSAQVTQNGTVTNAIAVQGTTGNNQLARNTLGGVVAGDRDNTGVCDKLAQAPEEPEKPEEPGKPGNGGGDNGDGNGGGNGDDGDGVGGNGDDGDAVGESAPQVAGAVSEKPAPRVNGGRSILTRFPVAGGEDVSRLLQGSRTIPWQSWALLGAALVLTAWQLDRRSQRLVEVA